MRTPEINPAKPSVCCTYSAEQVRPTSMSQHLAVSSVCPSRVFPARVLLGPRKWAALFRPENTRPLLSPVTAPCLSARPALCSRKMSPHLPCPEGRQYVSSQRGLSSSPGENAPHSNPRRLIFMSVTCSALFFSEDRLGSGSEKELRPKSGSRSRGTVTCGVTDGGDKGRVEQKKQC